MRPIERIAILFAMHEEASPIAERLQLGESKPLHGDLPARVRRGQIGAIEVIHCVNGTDPFHDVDRIGTEAATLTSWLLIEDARPDLLINAGTCGGFVERGGEIGRTYVGGEAFLYHDRRVPLPGFDAQAVGRIPARRFEGVERLLGIDSGPVSTGSSLTETEQELAFFTDESVVAKDMEAAAVAVVARDRRVPLLALKAITDLVDAPEPSHVAFLRNLTRTTERLTDHLEVLIRDLGQGRTLEDLTG